MAPLTYLVYQYISTISLLYGENRIIPAEHLCRMADTSHWKAEIHIKTELCNDDHCPWLKRPENMVEVLRRAAGEAVSRQTEITVGVP